MSELMTTMKLVLLLPPPLWTLLLLPMWTMLMLLLLLPPALPPPPRLRPRWCHHCLPLLVRCCLLLSCCTDRWRLLAAADCRCGLRCLCWGLMRTAQHTLSHTPPPSFASLPPSFPIAAALHRGVAPPSHPPFPLPLPGVAWVS